MGITHHLNTSLFSGLLLSLIECRVIEASKKIGATAPLLTVAPTCVQDLDETLFEEDEDQEELETQGEFDPAYSYETWNSTILGWSRDIVYSGAISSPSFSLRFNSPVPRCVVIRT